MSYMDENWCTGVEASRTAGRTWTPAEGHSADTGEALPAKTREEIIAENEAARLARLEVLAAEKVIAAEKEAARQAKMDAFNVREEALRQERIAAQQAGR